VKRGLDEALKEISASSESVFVIGGGSLYEEALKSPSCETLYITRYGLSLLKHLLTT
jgi:dihydrofolate reductase